MCSRCTFEMMAKKSGVGSADKLQVIIRNGLEAWQGVLAVKLMYR